MEAESSEDGSMATTSATGSEQDRTGLFRIATGAGVGLAAAFLDATALLILAGALLFLVSLFFYRRGFALLRKVDPRFTVASILCLIGTLGFILVLIAAVVIVGSASSLLSCISGQPTHALTCLRSGQPLGAYT